MANKELDAQWKEWKKKFEKEYSGPEEEDMRRDLWEKNWQEVEAHNKEYAQGKHTYFMRMNQFSDLTPEEMKSYCCGIIPPEENSPAEDESQQIQL